MQSERTEENSKDLIIIENDVPIPMRDGVVLRGNVFRLDTDAQLPSLLLRTPYGKPTGGYERYVRAGYVVVTQDSRGRYASDGDYVPFTVSDTGDAEDGYDTVEWLAQQPYCNDKVGTMGGSYNAWMQWQLAKLRPPHLVAMCAYTIPLELTEVDFSGGFKPGRRVKWWMTTIAPDLRKRQGLPPPHTPAEARKIWDEIEHGRWLGFMPWLDLPRYLPEKLAFYVDDWLKHPNRTPWKFEQIHSEVAVPNLDISGWYDHCNGTIAHLAGMQKNARTSPARNETKLVIGPWNHPGLGKQQIGEIDFGPQAKLDTDGLMIRWFDYWLKGEANGIEAEKAARYFVMGLGKWKTSYTWPPAGLIEKVYYLSSNGNAHKADDSGVLTPEQRGEEMCDEFTYDPNNPVPTLWTRELFTGPSDRRLLEYREDILYYRTPPLEADIEVVGYPEVVLYACSSAPDTDFFARLIDESPQGPALEVCYGMIRAKHRHSLDRNEPLEPNAITMFRIKLGATAIRFLKGHRIRLEITSSDFPNHDRNHNTGRNDLIDTELVAARQRVFHSTDYASRLLLPIDKA